MDLGNDRDSSLGTGRSGGSLSPCPESLSAQKKSLRACFLKKRSSLSPEFRKRADEEICRRITELPEFRNARIVAGYATDGTEPDVLPVLKKALDRGAMGCLPKWNGTEYILSLIRTSDIGGLVPGKWNLPEPVTTDPLPSDTEGILFLVPGAAFDDAFTRLGRGGGIYDRFLHAGKRLTALGVFYECQHSLTLPLEAHDEKMDIIVTETGVRFNRRKSHTEIENGSLDDCGGCDRRTGNRMHSLRTSRENPGNQSSIGSGQNAAGCETGSRSATA